MNTQIQTAFGRGPSGQLLAVFRPFMAEMPSSNYGVFGTRNASPHIAFDDSTAWNVIFSAPLPDWYSGGGITVEIFWRAATATTGDVVWNGYFERDDDNGQDMDSDSFASAQTATTTTAGASGALKKTTITFTNSQIDGLLAGEHFRFKLERNAASGSDTMTGNAQVTMVKLKET